ncbi:MAG: hypothetical protein GX957_05710 [Clostridiaceae bacterium]|nr:hypothetical protein [Clostridiaceae bacterium]
MNSKEIIKRVIDFKSPVRIGLDFNHPHHSDLLSLNLPFNNTGWGTDTSLEKEVPNFKGQLMKDVYGNIWGRLENISKGEVVKGALQDSWEKFKNYSMPTVHKEWVNDLKEKIASNNDKYVIGNLPNFFFSIMRTLRGMENFLMDILLEPEYVNELGEKITVFLEEIIDLYAAAGVDGIMYCEDWGTQTALLISPKDWRRVFKPWYQRISNKIHSHKMHMIMHSCGYIYDIVEDLIEVGIDVLQLDQPTLMDMERLSKEFVGRVTFYCPVDIQKIMQTGDKNLIEEGARTMMRLLGTPKGGFIAKDYPQWDAIDVKEEWAQWARDVFIKEGYLE